MNIRDCKCCFSFSGHDLDEFLPTMTDVQIPIDFNFESKFKFFLWIRIQER